MPPDDHSADPPVMLGEGLEGTHKAQADGLGLGLFIAAELARAHEGRIDVDSGEAGTPFGLRFPVDAPVSAPLDAPGA